MSVMSKGERLTLSIMTALVVYGVMTFMFSVGVLSDDFTVSAFIGCLPYMALVKLGISAAVGMVVFGAGLSLDIKATTVGNGQHGKARFAREGEKSKIYKEVSQGHEKEPGFVVERKPSGWLVDASDQNMLLVAPPGGGKTKSVYIPTIYYNAMVNKRTEGHGASLLLTDVKGELLASCGQFLKDAGYRVLYLDFRHPLESYHDNLMYSVNVEIDQYKAAKGQSDGVLHYARAERGAKTLAASVVENMGAVASSESSQFFNETSKGLITALILLVSEYGDPDERHIISVFKLITELNGLSEGSNEALQKNKLEELLKSVDNERILNYAGPAMKADVRTSMNIFSSALGKLVSFIDAELEQMVCDQSPELNDMDFITHPTAIFLICPDENTTRHFFATLFIRYLMNDLIAQAEETGGELSRKVLCLWDEFGQMPAIQDVDSLFTAVRSRGIRFMVALQSYAQLEKHYSHEMAKIIRDACQMTMFTYVSPSSRETADDLSHTLGNQTVQSGSVSTGHGGSTTLQMISQPLMAPDEIINDIPWGHWIVLKSGHLPVRLNLPLFSSYLKKLPTYEPEHRETELRPIHSLSGEKIKNYVTRQQAKLTRGMFD